MTELATLTYTSETGGQTAPDEEAEYSRQVNEYLAGLNEGMRAYVPDSVEDAENLVAGVQRDAAQLSWEDGKYRVNGVEVDATQAETLLRYARDGTDTWRLNDEAKAHATYILGLESYKQLDSALKNQLRLTKLTPSEPNEETFARYKDEMRARLELDKKLSGAGQTAETEGTDGQATEAAPENGSREAATEENEPAVPEVPATPETSEAALESAIPQPRDYQAELRQRLAQRRKNKQTLSQLANSGYRWRTTREAFVADLRSWEGYRYREPGNPKSGRLSPTEYENRLDRDLAAFERNHGMAATVHPPDTASEKESRLKLVGRAVASNVRGKVGNFTDATGKGAVAAYKAAVKAYESTATHVTERLKSGKRGARYLGRVAIGSLIDSNPIRVADMVQSGQELRAHNAAARAARLKRTRRQYKRPL